MKAESSELPLLILSPCWSKWDTSPGRIRRAYDEPIIATSLSLIADKRSSFRIHWLETEESYQAFETTISLNVRKTTHLLRGSLQVAKFQVAK